MDMEKVSKETEDELLTCTEAARAIRMSAQTIRTWILLGKIDRSKCFQAGKFGHWRIQRSALTKALTCAEGQN